MEGLTVWLLVAEDIKTRMLNGSGMWKKEFADKRDWYV